MEAKIKEIFESIQGEGPFVGYKQVFVRFCGCNLHCNYCDTDFGISNAITFTPQLLAETIKKEYNTNEIHSISITGGEPLLNADFLNEFIPLLYDTKIYLETNATLSDQLLLLKDKIDIISADIKLPSATGKDTFNEHDKFLSNCSGVYTFAKIVFDDKITDNEIKQCSLLGEKYGIELILQPKMHGYQMDVNGENCQNILNKFLSLHKKTRLIPQTHKFINLK